MRASFLICGPCRRYHKPLEPHPESPQRLEAVARVLGGLRAPGLRVEIHEPRNHDLREAEEVLRAVHSNDYLLKLRRVEKPRFLDYDTYVEPNSWAAALSAVATALRALRAAREEGAAVAAVRPPGHHASRGRASGFCLVNVAAAVAQEALKLCKRVAILDLDAHYGDGTAELFYSTSSVLYISLHEDPRFAFPYKGFPEEHGRGEGRGYTVNAILPVGATDHHYERVVEVVVEPVLRSFNPCTLIVSLGTDSHWRDEISDLEATVNVYYRIARRLRRVIKCPVVAVLEGGYDLWALPRALANFALGLVGAPQRYSEPRRSAPKEVDARLERFLARLVKVHGSTWGLQL